MTTPIEKAQELRRNGSQTVSNTAQTVAAVEADFSFLAGGVAGEVLTKASDSDLDIIWEAVEAGEEATEFTQKQLWGDLPLSINSTYFPPAGIGEYNLDYDNRKETSLTGTEGIDYPKLSTISMADGGVVFGLDIDQMNSVLDNKKSEVSENGERFISIPTHIEDFTPSDINIFMAVVANGEFIKPFSLHYTIPASFFAGAAGAFPIEFEEDGFTWYILSGAAAFNTTIADNRLIIYMGATARYSRVETTGAYSKYLHKNYQIVLSINDDYTLGDPVITEYLPEANGRPTTQWFNGHWLYRIAEFLMFDETVNWLEVWKPTAISALGHHQISFNHFTAYGTPNHKMFRNYFKSPYGFFWREIDYTMPITNFNAEEYWSIIYNKNIYFSWGQVSASSTQKRILRGKLKADGTIESWDTVAPTTDFVQGVSNDGERGFFIANGNLFYNRWQTVVGSSNHWFVREIKEDGTLGSERPMKNNLLASYLSQSRINNSPIFGLDNFVYQFSNITSQKKLRAVPVIPE